jgi:hypothetical protein
LVELYGDELPVELAQHLLAGKPILIDVACKLGCVCSGAGADVDPRESRARVTALEPPRTTGPVIDETVVVEAMLPLPASPRSAIDIVAPPVVPPRSQASAFVVPNDDAATSHVPAPSSGRHMSDAATTHASTLPTSQRRLSPARGVPRPVTGNLPTARDSDGRQLPRTYVARRRPPARLTRQAPDAEAPIPSSTESISMDETAGAPNEQARIGASNLENGAGSTAPSAPSAVVPTTASPIESFKPVPLPRSPSGRPSDTAEPTRFSERAVTLPVTPLSDGRRRDETPHAPAERPVMQLLTLGLLIAMIVLVSAAVGVLVGRWMSQH